MSSFLDGALKVMSRRRPMTAAEILDKALRRGLITTQGRTPLRTLEGALYTEEKQPDSRVKRVFEPGRTRARRNTVRWLAT